MTPEKHAATVANYSQAISNINDGLIDAGIKAEALAAAIRMEAAKVERKIQREPMASDEAEMLDVQKRAHEFINTMQVSGIQENVANTAIITALIERVTRTNGAAGAAHWLRNMAALIDKNGDFLEQTAKHH